MGVSSGQSCHGKFLVRAMWGPVPNDQDIAIILSKLEEAHLCLVYAWVEQNDSSTWFDALLTHVNINNFVVSLNRAHVFGCQFLGAPSLFRERKRGPSTSESKKGKKTHMILAQLMMKLLCLTSQVLLGRGFHKLCWPLWEVLLLDHRHPLKIILTRLWSKHRFILGWCWRLRPSCHPTKMLPT